ncbi:MAG TPA: TIGR00282 family metallophosphoesterase [Acholeplasmataceae bacterium]|nr:TIGR00282 family metallophosphoesterase [Acholeplasmataceae bacterium]
MKIVFIGDIYGEQGLTILKEKLPYIKEHYKPNILIANAENIANGRGITQNIYKEMMKLGFHALTMGNWTWANYELYDFIEESNIIRPANYVKAPGLGYKTINFNNKKLLVINLLGRIFMNPNLTNPFTTALEIIEKEKADYILIDMHAEATSEKIALGHYLDGKVNAIVGTHTHIQTNDDRILPKGTLYITDVGMTGPLDGVIGVDKEIVLERFLTGFSRPNIVASGPLEINGVFLDLDRKKIEKIKLRD